MKLTNFVDRLTMCFFADARRGHFWCGASAQFGRRLLPSFRCWATALALSTAAPVVTAAEWTTSDLMNWAEATYPQFFRGTQPNLSAPPYVYRYYPTTGNYIGVAHGSVYVLGPITGGAVLRVGSLPGFECVALADACRPFRSVLAVGDTATVAIDSTGRLLMLAADSNPLATDGVALPGQRMRVVALEAESMAHTERTAIVITKSGRVLGWGGGFWSAPFSSPIRSTAPVELDFGGRAAQIVYSESGVGPYVLLADGSAAYWQGPAQPSGSQLRGKSFAVQTPGPLRQIAVAGTTPYLLTRDGAVWQGHFAAPTKAPIALPGVTDVRQMSCSSYLCAAVQYDGTVLTWPVAGDPKKLNIAKRMPAASPIAQVAVASYYWMTAVGVDGSLWVSRGATLSSDGSFVLQPGIGPFSEVGCSLSNCLALHRDGRLWGWGYLSNTKGMFGPNVTISNFPSSPPPMLVPSAQVP